jgi:membrane protease YdiL (CAAX protease family)
MKLAIDSAVKTKLARGAGEKEGAHMQAEPLRGSSTHSLLTFFVLTFALSWWPWPLVLLNPDSLTLLPWSPLVAAFIMAVWVAGRRGVKDLLVSMVRWQVGLRWYAVAVLLPVATIILAASMNVLLGAEAPAASEFSDWYTFPLVLLVTFFLKGPFTEEVAWRGYALPRLLQRISPLAASLLLGAVWALWHLPLLVSDPTSQRPPAQFVAWVIAASILITWLYLRSDGSVLLATLMHAMFNSLASFVFPVFQGDGYGQLWWLYAGVLWAAALAATLATRGRLGYRDGEAIPRADAGQTYEARVMDQNRAAR